jgi:hypothetical protein
MPHDGQEGKREREKERDKEWGRERERERGGLISPSRAHLH